MTNWLRGRWWLLGIAGVFAWLLIWHFKANFVLAIFAALAIGLVVGALAVIKRFFRGEKSFSALGSK